MTNTGTPRRWITARLPFPTLPPARRTYAPVFITGKQVQRATPEGSFYPELPAPIADVWGNPGVDGGIPSYSVGVSVASYGAVGDGTTDDTTAFTNAYNAASAGTAIYVPPGTYRLTSSITIRKGVVFRGAGTTSQIVFDRSTSGEGFRFISASSHGSYANLTGGHTAGSYTVTLASTTGFSAGDYVEIKQTNDSTLITDPQAWSTDAQGQVSKIASTTSTTITLEDPLLLNYTSAQTPQIRKLSVIENAGLEDLYITTTDTNTTYNIYMSACVNCWITGVEGYLTYDRHMTAFSSYRVEVRECYFHGSHNFTGGHGYGVTLDTHTSRCLIENNLFYDLRHAMMVKMGSSGNVFGYNYSSYGHNENPDPNNRQVDVSLHGHYPAYNLWEGNSVDWIGNSDSYGPSGHGNTFFRNQVKIDSTSLYADTIFIFDESHNQNVIGNTLVYGGIELETGAAAVFGTLIYGNRLTESSDVPSDATLDSLPDSYYLTGAPSWYTLSFPSIGAEFASGTIPAGNLVITPTAAQVAVGATNPTTIQGSINITPGSAAMDTGATDPGVTLSSITITPASAQMDIGATDPAVGLSSMDVTPGAAQVAIGATDPTTIQGNISITPDAAQMDIGATAPGVALSSITITPTAAQMAISATDPAVGLSSMDVTPTAAQMDIGATNPAVTAGSISITPSAGQVAIGATNPGITLSSINITPDAAQVAIGATNPAVTTDGNLDITPAAAQVAIGATDPAVVLSSITITPTAAQVDISATDPTVTAGGDVTITPTAAQVDISATNPGVALSSITIAPDAAQMDIGGTNPGVVLSSINITPDAAQVDIGATSPGITLSSITITPTSAQVAISATDPTVTISGDVITPGSAQVAIGATDPTVILSSISITPDAAQVDIGATNPDVRITGTIYGRATGTLRLAKQPAGTIRAKQPAGVIQ